ncbi:MAG TPA: fumarylacetoacetate hydrolase family protein [Burkholderiales bacterium]|nr:fumarylacetoacetate hydrolase family protein [Burkholderiales bacterium]
MDAALKVYHTPSGVAVLAGQRWNRVRDFSFDALFRATDPLGWLRSRLEPAEEASVAGELHPPLEGQEVWAAGVTYFRSREARMEESEREADVYDRVYEAERPELFFKATPHRVVGHGADVRVRADSSWNVPEAELALAVNREGRIFGYTVGNDMSSRSIEGANPLYLPQAKIYDGGCALGPCLLLSGEPLAPSTEIALRIARHGTDMCRGCAQISQMRRTPEELVRFLFRACSFPNGCYLLTGTGIVPEGDFTLASGDEIEITIEPIGTLANRVR